MVQHRWRGCIKVGRAAAQTWRLARLGVASVVWKLPSEMCEDISVAFFFDRDHSEKSRLSECAKCAADALTDHELWLPAANFDEFPSFMGYAHLKSPNLSCIPRSWMRDKQHVKKQA
jgi:hypothetical protein